MHLACIQTRQCFAYDPSKPGEYDLQRCRDLAAEGMAEGFALMEQAADQGADLLVTIEAYNATVAPHDPRYQPQDWAEPLDGPLVKRFSDLAKRRSVHIVAGLYTTREGKAYNSALLLGPDGALLGVFDKVHLPAGEELGITAGSSYPVFETEYGRIGMLVCWDLQYPEAARILALQGADLIAVPTWGWEDIGGRCRAYENGVTIAAAMGVPVSGVIWDFCTGSTIVDNMGTILAQGTRSGAQIVSAEVDIRREPAPQYGAGDLTGLHSMRQIRLSQRRPDTYGLLTEATPPLAEQYRSGERPATSD